MALVIGLEVVGLWNCSAWTLVLGQVCAGLGAGSGGVSNSAVCVQLEDIGTTLQMVSRGWWLF